jgi:hypothetical protein
MIKYLLLLLSFPAFANTSTAGFRVSGTVPLVLKVNITKVANTKYLVYELSNSPTGYKVTLHTDIEDSVITNVVHQDEYIETTKEITLPDTVTYAIVTIEAN